MLTSHAGVRLTFGRMVGIVDPGEREGDVKVTSGIRRSFCILTPKAIRYYYQHLSRLGIPLTWTSNDPDDPSLSSDVPFLDPDPDIFRGSSSDPDYVLGDGTESLVCE
jgi:hypothetical protein